MPSKTNVEQCLVLPKIETYSGQDSPFRRRCMLVSKHSAGQALGSARLILSQEELCAAMPHAVQLDKKATIISPFAASHWLGGEVRLDVDPTPSNEALDVATISSKQEDDEVDDLVAATQGEASAVSSHSD